MDDPDRDLRADADERAGSPDFDALTDPTDLVRGERTRDDFFDAVLALDEPATVEEVAELAGHGRDAAREYLDWFERMGIVERVSERPATYRLNREYLVWRRVQRTKREYDAEELVAMLDAEAERDEAFAAQFGVDRPDQVRLHAHARSAETTVEEAWRDLSAWRTARRRIEILERALAGDAESASGRRHGTA
jgi:predicted ArsR family transcriptional regulator